MVKGLVNHDKGNTLKTILKEFDKAGYIVDYKVLNSIDYGVAQMRERIYFVGIKKDLKIKEFKWPPKIKHVNIQNFLMLDNNIELKIEGKTFQKYINNKYNKNKFDINKILKTDYLVLDTRQSDLRIYKNKVPTLRTGRHGILFVKDNKLFKLNAKNALYLQGFPNELIQKIDNFNINNTRILAQAGNAMTVNVIENICSSR